LDFHYNVSRTFVMRGNSVKEEEKRNKKVPFYGLFPEVRSKKKNHTSVQEEKLQTNTRTICTSLSTYENSADSVYCTPVCSKQQATERNKCL